MENQTMNMGQAISSGFKRYVDFQGRSARSEYWWWTLFVFLVNIFATIIDSGTSMDLGIASIIATLVLLLPGIGMSIRRLHDVDRSGWWLFIFFVPIVGLILLLVWACSKGTTGPNRFGADQLS